MNDNHTCYICKLSSNHPDFTLTGLKFQGLAGEPVICEQCLARQLGMEVSWKPEIEEMLERHKI